MADHYSDDNLSDCEQQVINDIEARAHEYEQMRERDERERQDKVGQSFSSAALSLTMLFKECDHQRNPGAWNHYQNASYQLASLYKESLQGMKRCKDLSSQSSLYRHKKDVAIWAKKKKLLRRDELYSLLTGRQISFRSNNIRASPRQRLNLERSSMTSGHHNLDSNNLLDVINPSISHLQFSPRRRGELEQLFEIGMKRPSSPDDVCMDSPSHKRFRYT